MRFKHTHRPGFWLGFIDFFTAGLFFLLYMPLGGLQDELDEILGHAFGLFLMGPAVATGRFFDTLNKIEQKLSGKHSGPACLGRKLLLY